MRGARRRPAALLAALALAVLLAFGAGCGGDDTERDNAYVAELNAAQTEFADTVERLDGRVTGDSTARQDRETLGAFAEAADEVAVAVREIQPPEAVADVHAGLVGDFETYAGEVRAAVESLSSGDSGRLVAAQERLREATDTVSAQINQAIDDINGKLQAG